ncbi:MAG: DUF4159 domain-containing protein [Geminicoccaceae bacterium]
MLQLGPLAFAQPWLLAALLALPAVWWLLRIIPPAPRRLRFPGIVFLLGLQAREETPARTPLWLLLMRLAAAALIILALAAPVLNPDTGLQEDGPVILVVDDGWAAAPRWSLRRDAMTDVIDRAGRDGRAVVLLGTAAGSTHAEPTLLNAADANAAAGAWEPVPFGLERREAAARLAGSTFDGVADVVWLSDGVSRNAEGAAGAADVADDLRRLGPLRVLSEDPAARADLLLPPEANAAGLTLVARRADDGPARDIGVRALGDQGQVLLHTEMRFADGEREARASVSPPLGIRNSIQRLVVEGRDGVGTAVLLDESMRRKVVGLVDPGEVSAQPLLSELYYVERALRPYAEIVNAPLERLVDLDLSLIILGDAANVPDTLMPSLENWLDRGGVLVRFAGPRLAEGTDRFVPVPLRVGDRNLGGALSWSQPLPLAPFEASGPLANLPVPDDVRVTRQVLAQPGPELDRHTWARLSDGTPLITGESRGDGSLVLVHTTANTAWSDLALSGAFVDLLRRFVDLARGVEPSESGELVPQALLDAFGNLRDQPGMRTPIPAAGFAGLEVSVDTPAGLYVPPDAPESAAHALNLSPSFAQYVAIDDDNLPVRPMAYVGTGEVPLLPWLLGAAFVLLLLDLLISYGLRGLLPLPARATATAGLAALMMAPPVLAQSQDAEAIMATDTTHLAYVVTGASDLDERSRAGLEGLALVLNQRTAIETGDPVAVDPEQDELALYPLIYWPIAASSPSLSADAKAELNAYFKRGGMVLFDTSDAGSLLPGQTGQGAGGARLREVLEDVDIAPMRMVPEDHVLTRSFYLLQEFPGRFTGQPVWVDQVPEGVNDGVSSVIIGAHDWAGAWAIDEYGLPLLPVVPGGERQREMARRFGVNLVMYALTGNYKTDQVHVPALLERLGQ